MTEAHVQNRLTVLAANLSLLVFVTIGLISLTNAQGKTEDLIWIYLNSFVPISVGFLLSVSGIAAFLRYQQDTGQAAWFTMGQILLYLAVAQFLASGMNNIVNGLSVSFREHEVDAGIAQFLVYSLVLFSQALWLWLLIGGPISHLRGWEEPKFKTAKRKMWAAYFVALLGVLVLNAVPYYLKHGEGWGDFGPALVLQIFQPFLWVTGGGA